MVEILRRAQSQSTSQDQPTHKIANAVPKQTTKQKAIDVSLDIAPSLLSKASGTLMVIRFIIRAFGELHIRLHIPRTRVMCICVELVSYIFIFIF